MANQLSIVIAAVDKSGSAFNSAQSKLTKLEKNMKAANSASFSRSPVQNFMRSAGRATAMGGAITAGVAAAVALAISKIVSMEGVWANTMRSMSNKSITLGIDTRQLLGIQNAAKQVGLTADQATSSVESVQRGYYEATQGRDLPKLQLYQAYGINGKDRSGRFSDETLLEQIAAAGQHVNAKNGPNARKHLFESLDASGLADLLNKGPAAMRSLYSKGLQLAPTLADIKAGVDYADAMSKLDLQFDKTKQTILGGLAPALTTLLGGIDKIVKKIPASDSFDAVHEAVKRLNQPYGTQNPVAKTAGARFADKVADGFEQFGNYAWGHGNRTNPEVAAMPNPNVPRAIKFYENNGLSHNQALGMVANGIAESDMDPRAVGDNGKAFGVFQWHADRLKEFEKATGHRFNQSSLEDQLRYSLHEMRNGNEQKAGAYLEMAKTPGEAGSVVSSMYERPAGGVAEAARRAGIASSLAATLYPPKSPTAANSAGAASAGADQTGKVDVNIKFGNMPKGTSTSVTSSPNVRPSVSNGRTDQFALGATY